MTSLRLAVLGLALAVPHTVLAQVTSTAEIWPELDVHWWTSNVMRTVLEMSLSTERERTSREATVGLFEDYHKLPGGYIRAGFRYTFSTTDASYQEYRGVGDAVLRVYGTKRVRLLNRTRGELRWVNGEYSYRLRDRLHLQRLPRDTTGRAWAPYGTAEVYYDSRYAGIPRIGGRVGTEVRLGHRARIDVYVAHQHDTRPERANISAFGVTTRLTYGSRRSVEPRSEPRTLPARALGEPQSSFR